MRTLAWFLLSMAALVAAQAPSTRTLTQADIDTILSMHNSLRSKISPIATNMLRVTWDPTLAASAQAYANTCPTAHSGKPNLGENLSWGWPTMSASEAVNEWIKEGPHYSFSANACAAGTVCAHYTQMIWSNSDKVGCAMKSCPNLLGQPVTDAWVCHYTMAGNVVGSLPYAPGPVACSACPNTTVCVENLCSLPGTQSTPAGQQPSASAAGQPTGPATSPIAGPAQAAGGQSSFAAQPPSVPVQSGSATAGGAPVMTLPTAAAQSAGRVAAPPQAGPVVIQAPALVQVEPVTRATPAAPAPVIRPVPATLVEQTVTMQPVPIAADDRLLASSPTSPFVIVQTKPKSSASVAGTNSTNNTIIPLIDSGMGRNTTNNAIIPLADPGKVRNTTTIVGFAPRTFGGK